MATDDMQQSLSLLDLNDDVLAEVCVAVAQLSKLERPRFAEDGEVTLLQAFSMTCRRLRRAAASSLFYGIKIGPHGWDLVRVGDTIDSLGLCPYTRAYTRRLHFVLFPENSPIGKERRLPARIADIFINLRRLQRLTFSVPECQNISARFEKIFMGNNLQLRWVDTLHLPNGSHWLINCCPNLTTLRLGTTPEVLLATIIENSKHILAHIQHLEMAADWNTELLKPMLKIMSNLRTLAMVRGALHYRESIEDMVPVLARFTKLKTLVLASVINLKVGFCIPYSGGAYNGYKQVGPPDIDIPKERLEANHFVADLVLTGCPDLQELWIGDFHKATRNKAKEGDNALIEISEAKRAWPPTG
ncbi:hypothetical protein AC578_10156 [Pseudocercospora eumusae]|uniref:F-box domain-containing protein n=1 Tax=Pseudocercospora eumusae TaxID=321146 RepID=A0A139HYS7_9PEZI|nr:hypothetical protein AC578_10156 [Pseudocercospora eumusae]